MQKGLEMIYLLSVRGDDSELLAGGDGSVCSSTDTANRLESSAVNNQGPRTVCWICSSD
jgi:hypothetical protein